MSLLRSYVLTIPNRVASCRVISDHRQQNSDDRLEPQYVRLFSAVCCLASLSTQPFDLAPGACLARRALHPAGIGTSGVPQRDRHDPYDGFNDRDSGPHLAFRTGEQCCSGLSRTCRIQRLVSFRFVMVDKRVVAKRVLNLDRWRLKERSFALRVRASRHSIFSRFTASSRYASAERDLRAC